MVNNRVFKIWNIKIKMFLKVKNEIVLILVVIIILKVVINKEIFKKV